jgi:hypothetical protein
MLEFRQLRSLAVLVPFALAGCTDGSNATSATLVGIDTSKVTTGSIPNDSTSRTLQVAAVSARASYCGYVFEPAKLKASFLASESTQGATQEQLQKIDRDYEYVRLSLAKAISKDTDYCNDQRSKVIKAELARHLAGDFTPTPTRQYETPGLLARIFDPDAANSKPFSYSSVFDITGKTKNSSEQ